MMTNMNILKKAGLLVASLLVFASLSFAQTSLRQTTLSSAVTVGPSGSPSGQGAGTFQTSVTLASGTGVQTAFNGQPITILYVDTEAMGVLTNPNGTTYTVLRGLLGTKTAPHSSGSMVLLGVVTPQFSGNSGSGGFQNADPPIGACTAANTLVTPWVNVLTGAQWICNSVWVPGFNNPREKGETVSVASVAGTTTPSGTLFHISGTNAITAWGIPVGCNATTHGSCSFTVIPDAAFTTTATNNIATAVTAVANLAQIWLWDAANSKFVVIQSK